MDKKALLVVIVLAVLVVVAGVQAVQLTSIKNSLVKGESGFSTSGGSAPRTQQVVSSPTSYSGMVGGC